MAASWALVAVLVCAVLGSTWGRHTKTRIIGGREAGVGEAPYQVSLRYTGALPGGRQVEKEHFCGGALIDQETVLTASHCLLGDYGSAEKLTVVGGALGLHELSEDRQERDVVKVVPHAGYGTGFVFRHDIALLKVSPPFPPPSATLKPIPLRASPVAVDTACVLTGWGLHGAQSAGYSENLNLLQLAVVNQSVCIDRFNETLNATNAAKILCVYHTNIHSSAGSGDSGGPLVCGGELSGVLSFGAEEQTLTDPTVFSDVQSYLDWIEENRGPPAVSNVVFAAAVSPSTPKRPTPSTPRRPGVPSPPTPPNWPWPGKPSPPTPPNWPWPGVPSPPTPPNWPWPGVPSPPTPPNWPGWPNPPKPPTTPRRNSASTLTLAPVLAVAALVTHACWRT